jgi:peptide/nickel transport system substrate-binding protein
MAHAIPYNEILDSVWLGLAKKMDDVVAPSYPGYAPNAYSYDTDLEKAKQLLTKAGFPKGFSFELAYGTDSDVHQQTAVLIQTYLAKIGVEAKLRGMPQGTLSTLTYSKKTEPAWVHVDQALVPDGGYSDGVWFNSTQFYDYNHYKNLAVDKLLVASNFEPNHQKRVKLIQQANRQISRDISWLCIAFTGYQVATRDNVGGPVWNASNTVHFDTLTKT